MKKCRHIIREVEAGSIAEELELAPGDELLSINGQEIEDVFDYHYLVNDEYIEVLVQKADGEQWELEVEKDYEEDLGIVFENSLMDEYRSCSNHCVFCFIDQMPPGMRETLYFKDDDSRLSFLQEMCIRDRDARIPVSSRNPDIDELGKNKARLILLNKSDLADERQNEKWTQHFTEKGFFVVKANSKSGAGIRQVLPVIMEAVSYTHLHYAIHSAQGWQART